MWGSKVLAFYMLLYVETGICAKDWPNCDAQKINTTQFISCSSQIWGTPVGNPNDTNCALWLHAKSPARGVGCEDLQFAQQGVTSDKFGKVSLKAYYDSMFKQTVFNVTFSNIKWTDLHLRFSESNNKFENFCRKFTISSEKPVPPESILFYDCLWSDQKYEYKSYILEYFAKNENEGGYAAVGTYGLFVPGDTYINPEKKKLNESEVFVYMDLSDLPLLKLRLQLDRDRFEDVRRDQYNITIHHSTVLGELVKKLKLSPSDDNDNTDELTFVYDTTYDSGKYYFTARIEHENCSMYLGGCKESKTPEFIINEDVTLHLLIGIVGCGGALLSIFVIGYFLWTWSQRHKKRQAPTVLIIYMPTSEAHIRSVIELAKFLKNFCFVNALLDDLDIPKTKMQDPFIWCNDAFLNSDFVMVLTSPYQKCKNMEEGVYRNVDGLGLRNLKEKLSDRKTKQQFFTAILPYCTEKDIPFEAKLLKRFVLMKDFDKMLAFIHSTPCRQKFDIEQNGSTLLNALSVSKLEVEKQNCICGNLEHHKLSLDDLDTIDLTPRKDTSADMLLPPRDGNGKPTTLNMYPGPIDDLNLLGKDNDDFTDDNCKVNKSTTKIVSVDLNDLDL